MTPPRLRPTRPGVVVGCAVLGLVLGRALEALYTLADRTAPTVPWGAVAVLGSAAAALFVLAWTTWQALHRRHDRMTSDRAVRLLALAKASIVAGAVVAGGYLGYALGFVDARGTELGGQRIVRSLLSALAAAAVVVGALLLERACQRPDAASDDEPGGAERSG